MRPIVRGTAGGAVPLSVEVVVPFPAGGNIGADAVAKSALYGYTLVMSALGPHAVNVSLFATIPYDPVRDFGRTALVLEAEGLARGSSRRSSQ